MMGRDDDGEIYFETIIRTARAPFMAIESLLWHLFLLQQLPSPPHGNVGMEIMNVPFFIHIIILYILYDSILLLWHMIRKRAPVGAFRTVPLEWEKTLFLKSGIGTSCGGSQQKRASFGGNQKSSHQLVLCYCDHIVIQSHVGWKFASFWRDKTGQQRLHQPGIQPGTKKKKGTRISNQAARCSRCSRGNHRIVHHTQVADNRRIQVKWPVGTLLWSQPTFKAMSPAAPASKGGATPQGGSSCGLFRCDSIF